MSGGLPLNARLLAPIETLPAFQSIATDALAYLTAGELAIVSSATSGRQHYDLWNFKCGSKSIPIRPVNTTLYINTPAEFDAACTAVRELLADLATDHGPTPALLDKHRTLIERGDVQRVFYTMQQSYGIACDALMTDANRARKHVGMKFEALIGATFTALGIANRSLVFNIPGGDGRPSYRADIDFVIGPDPSVVSTALSHDPREVIVSVKGSSKDRMSKIFIDRLLLETIAGHTVKMIGIFHNDVQRKSSAQISGTFVANLFLIYSMYLKPLSGVYFVDPPPHIERPPWNRYLKRFQDLLVFDVWNLLKATV
ncbi:MAG TPA: hypothetical protein VG713_05115 [Pirellulales bacterium]|nr:hypothetical protein [Pirellulales bacterium]